MLLGLLAIATAVGVVALWPHDGAPPAGGPRLDTERARVTSVEEGACRSGAAPAPGGGVCRRVLIRVLTGPGSGTEAGFDLGPGFPVAPGDHVRVVDNGLPPGAVVGGVPADPYSFADFERGESLVWLTGIFAALVLVAARWRGLRALVGLGASLVVIVAFIVPAIVAGSEPVLVAIVGCMAILLVSVPLAHGVSPVAVAAVASTAAALVLTLVLGRVATGAAHITGFGTDEAAYLQASLDGVSIRGLLLAGMVIAALGVLDDLTITQASAVAALRRTDPTLGAGALFREGVTVGRDHVVAVVNTLVLAYAGASLPVLIVFSLADTSVTDAITTEAVASEIVATLVGSIGLIAAVPLATGLAAALTVRVPPEALPDAHHDHGHHA
jgi:uncharacterized membrane protein